MGDVDFRELLVDLIGYASIVSAAIFGLIGLFTEYKKGGRVTLWGRLAAGGIGMSAVFAMTSAVLQKQLNTEQQANARKTAANQRALQQAQFNVQLGQLTGLNRQMGGVNQANRMLLGRMEQSLAGQQRNLLLTTALGAQQRKSTGQVLLSLWTEANRIDGNSVELQVTTACSLPEGVAMPKLFGDGAIASITLYSEKDVKSLEAFGTFDRPKDARSLLSNRAETIVMARTVAMYSLSTARFHSFQIENPDQIAAPDSWRDVYVDIRVVGPFPPDLQKIPWQTNEMMQVRFGDQRIMSWSGSEQVVRYLSCEVDLALIVRGRVLMHEPAFLVVVRDKQGVLSLHARQPLMPLSDKLPRYGGR